MSVQRGVNALLGTRRLQAVAVPPGSSCTAAPRCVLLAEAGGILQRSPPSPPTRQTPLPAAKGRSCLRADCERWRCLKASSPAAGGFACSRTSWDPGPGVQAHAVASFQGSNL